MLIHDEKLSKRFWKCIRVKKLIYGRDSKIRSCILQTENDNLKRPVQILYNLELDFLDKSTLKISKILTSLLLLIFTFSIV